MKITIENLNDFSPIKDLLYQDLLDIEEINELTDKEFYIDYQDFHDEYSPERTDPCPDYYGYFSIREKTNPLDVVGYRCENEEDLEYLILAIYDICNIIKPIHYYEVGEGWHPLIKEAKRIVREWNFNHPNEEPIRFVQIKEKFGGLRLYVTTAPREILDKLDELEDKSYSICECCGSTKNVETKTTRGWIYTLCNECRKEQENG